MAFPALSPGDQGPEVSALQLALVALGLHAGTVDGVYGEDTASAVSRVQESGGVAVSGEVDDDTWALLVEQAALDSSQKSEVSAQEFPSLARAIYFSDDIDAYLQDLGIDSSSISGDESPNA